VLSLREVHVSAPAAQSVAFYRAALDAMVGKELPIRTGKDRLAVTVKIVWSFQ